MPTTAISAAMMAVAAPPAHSRLATIAFAPPWVG
jgi:hypothetical protein